MLYVELFNDFFHSPINLVTATTLLFRSFVILGYQSRKFFFNFLLGNRQKFEHLYTTLSPIVACGSREITPLPTRTSSTCLYERED